MPRRNAINERSGTADNRHEVASFDNSMQLTSKQIGYILPPNPLKGFFGLSAIMVKFAGFNRNFAGLNARFLFATGIPLKTPEVTNPALPIMVHVGNES